MTSATPVVDNDYRKHQPTMMKKHTILEPGPYRDSVGGECVVLSVGQRLKRVMVNTDGDMIIQRYEVSDQSLAKYTPMDHWPEWWPFQDAALLERTPQVGDWVRRESWRTYDPAVLITGNRFGRWQVVHQDGYGATYPSLDGFTVVPAPEGVEQ